MTFQRRWIPAFAGMTLLWGGIASADSLLPGKKAPAQFVPVDQAFELQPLERRDGKLIVSWRIARNYYLYRDRLKFTLLTPEGARLGAAQLPAPLKCKDEYFGDTDIYRERLQAELPLTGAATGPVRLTVAYQGCADAGLCYPVQTRTLEIGN